jgi:hypothetical protein
MQRAARHSHPQRDGRDAEEKSAPKAMNEAARIVSVRVIRAQPLSPLSRQRDSPYNPQTTFALFLAAAAFGNVPTSASLTRDGGCFGERPEEKSCRCMFLRSLERSGV